MKKKFNIGIIGAGKLGKNLLEVFLLKKYQVWILDSSDKDRIDLKKKYKNKITFYPSLASIKTLPDFIFLTVPDSEIETVSDKIAEKFQHELANKFIVHCSGVLSIDELKACSNFKAITVNTHPYQTFYNINPKLFRKISWGIDCKKGFKAISELIKSINGIPIKLSQKTKEHKALYHLSAVAASNFLSSALAYAKIISDEAGIKASKFAPKIIETTIRNIFDSIDNNKEFPLTGPIARADIKTINLHLEALKSKQEELQVYSYFSLATLEMAKLKKSINNQQYSEIKKILLTSLNQ